MNRETASLLIKDFLLLLDKYQVPVDDVIYFLDRMLILFKERKAEGKDDDITYGKEENAEGYTQH